MVLFERDIAYGCLGVFTLKLQYRVRFCVWDFFLISFVIFCSESL